MSFEVYCHTAPSGKSYVGWTGQGWRLRWADHVKLAVGGGALPLHRAIRQYGANSFSHVVLERMSTRGGAKMAERLWIARLGTFGRGGYNATTGGDGAAGRRHSSETRAKIAAAHVGFAGCKHSAATRERMRSRRHTSEAIAKMRDAAARRPRRGGRFV